ncbi:uncharacterized protein LOC142543440 isoform X2 [Primulina tabacum]
MVLEEVDVTALEEGQLEYVNIEVEVEQEPSIRPERYVARNAEVHREVQQLTQRMRKMEFVIAKFQDMRPSKFIGNEGGEKTAVWLKSMNYLVNFVEYTLDLRLKLIVYQLKDQAQLCWEATEEALREYGQINSWEVFRTRFIQKYSPPSYYSVKEAEFNQLVQENMSVEEYVSQFSALLAYVPHVSNNDQSKLSRFMHRLNRTTLTLVMTGSPTTYTEAVEKAKNIEASLLWEESQQVISFTSQDLESHIQMSVGIPPYQPP